MVVPGRKQKAQGVAQSVDQGVDLGIEPAPGAADCPVFFLLSAVGALVDFDAGGVDADSLTVCILRQSLKEGLQDALVPPLGKPVIYGIVLAIAFRHKAPLPLLRTQRIPSNIVRLSLLGRPRCPDRSGGK